LCFFNNLYFLYLILKSCFKQNYLINSSISLKVKPQIVNNFYLLKKKKKIKSFLKYKLLNILLENTIQKFMNVIYKVHIQNILVTTKDFFLLQNVKKVEKYKNELFYLFMLSTCYINSQILSDYLAIYLSKTKKHYQILYKFTESLESFFFSNVLKMLGIQVRAGGKLGGKMRKSKYHYKLGKVQLQTLYQRVSYSISLSFTKFGVIAIKI